MLLLSLLSLLLLYNFCVSFFSLSLSLSLFPLKSTSSPAVVSEAVSTGGASAIYDRVGPLAFLRSGIVVRARSFGVTRWFTFHNLLEILEMRTVYVETFITFYVCLCFSSRRRPHDDDVIVCSLRCVYLRICVRLLKCGGNSYVSFSCTDAFKMRERISINIDLSPTSLRSCPRPRRRRRPR